MQAEMQSELIVRPAQAEDAPAWLALWRGYCGELDGEVSDEVTKGVWKRILSPEEPVGCLPHVPTHATSMNGASERPSNCRRAKC